MKKVSLYEFKDLSSDIKAKVMDKEREQEIDWQMQQLGEQLEKKEITKAQYYKTIGCSETYAESTAWFVPNCYYEHNHEVVDNNTKIQVNTGLYTESGKWVMPL